MPAGRLETVRKVRVCCFCECWESGGIESFLYNVLTRIDLTQLQVDVVASSLRKSIFTQPLQKQGVYFFELSGSQRKVAENRRRFRSLLQRRRYDVLHLNAFQGLSLCYLRLGREAGIPVRIVHSHNTALRKSLTRPLKLALHTWAKEWYTRDATALWACSRDAAEFLFPAQVLKQSGFQFIPNGIDIARFRFNPAIREGVRAELGLKEKFVIGNVGRLCYQKNQSFLLEVLKEVLTQHPDTCLLLAGEGEDKPLLVRKARQLGIEEKVMFYGLSSNVEQLLWAMDVFAFPSWFEGLGIAAIEAQAAGLPVVCSEYVPQETHLTKQIWDVPLSKGAGAWAKALLGCGTADREAAFAAVQDAGFGIDAIAMEMDQAWRKADG